MTRYIDADKLPYTMLYKENFMKGTGYEAQAVWKDDIDNAPTVDAVPVVRCKHCMFYEISGNGCNGWCNNFRNTRNSWEYCSDGERKEE